MITASRLERYRQLSAQLGEKAACELIDKLQVLALTQPDTLREIEAFFGQGLARESIHCGLPLERPTAG